MHKQDSGYFSSRRRVAARNRCASWHHLIKYQSEYAQVKKAKCYSSLKSIWWQDSKATPFHGSCQSFCDIFLQFHETFWITRKQSFDTSYYSLKCNYSQSSKKREKKHL